MPEVIHFVLAANAASSITRVVAEYANALVEQGQTVHISYPVFSFWDHCLWMVERDTASRQGWWVGIERRLKFWRALVGPTVKTIIASRGLSWVGVRIHQIDARVIMHRFWALPSVHQMPDADAIVVMQSYFIPRLLFLPAAKGKLVSSVHMDYEQALQDRDSVSRDWWAMMVSIEQRTHIPRFAVSQRAKESAEALGISVRCIIRNGVNHKEFIVPQERSRGALMPIRVMLSCALLPAKGQDFGCNIIRRLREMYPNGEVFFVSIGTVEKKNMSLFDENLGYLHGAHYVRAYQRADIFIYPSLRDGFPAPPLEALASGAVLATTRVSGVSEYGVSGKNCLMADPRDVDGMVSNIQRLIEDPDLRESLRREGYQTVKEYAWQRSALELVEFIRDLTGSV